MRGSGAGTKTGETTSAKQMLSLLRDPLTIAAEYLPATDRSSLFCSSAHTRELAGPVNATTLRQVFPEFSAELEKQHKGKTDCRWVVGELRKLYQQYYAIHTDDEPNKKRRKNLLWYARTGNWSKFISASPTLSELISIRDNGMPKQESLIGLITSKHGRSWLDGIYQKLAIPKFKTPADDALLDISRIDDDEAHLLHWAVACIQIETVTTLLAAGVDVNQSMPRGVTALYIAAQNGHNEAVKILSSTPGIAINQTKTNGATALHIAAQNGHSEAVKILSAAPGIAINQAMPSGATPFYIAAQYGHNEAVKILLEAPGVAINQATTRGATTALYIAAENGHSKVVELLVRATGIAINQARANGDTALLMAAKKGHSDVVKILSTAPGIAINQAMQDGTTALYMAAYYGHSEVVKVLLKAPGIEVNQTKLVGGATALMIAAHQGHSDVVRILVAAPGIAINQAKPNGVTALHMAASRGHSDVVKILVAAPGIKINKQISDDATALFTAAELGHSEVVKALLKAPGIEVNKAKPDGATALFIAAEKGHIDIISILPFNNIPYQRTASVLKYCVGLKSDDIKARMNAHIGDAADDALVEITAIEIAEIMGHDDIVCELEAKRMSQSLECCPSI